MDKNKVFQRRVLKAKEVADLRRQWLDIYLEDYIAKAAAKLSEQMAPVEVDYGIPAVRGWYVREGTLRALAFPEFEYEGPVTEDDASPTWHNPRGLWAVRPSRVDWLVHHYNPDVVGWVELTGKIIEHEYGWRAETCTIQELFLFFNIVPASDLAHLREALEKRYQCEVHISSRTLLQERMLNEHR